MSLQLPLLIFDLDGVLVDSETISERLFVKCLQDDDFAIDAEFNKRHFLGRALPDCLNTLQQHFGRQPSAGVLHNYTRQIAEALRSELAPVPFVRDALQQMPHRKCVASGSDAKRIQLSLDVTGLASFFSNITSAFEVEKGKPAPDVFLRAAEKNNRAAENCIVIEDTIFGVQAGIAAGMKVLCYQPDAALAYNVPDSVIVFNSMKHLPDLIQQVNNRG